MVLANYFITLHLYLFYCQPQAGYWSGWDPCSRDTQSTNTSVTRETQTAQWWQQLRHLLTRIPNTPAHQDLAMSASFSHHLHWQLAYKPLSVPRRWYLCRFCYYCGGHDCITVKWSPGSRGETFYYWYTEYYSLSWGWDKTCAEIKRIEWQKWLSKKFTKQLYSQWIWIVSITKQQQITVSKTKLMLLINSVQDPFLHSTIVVIQD